MPQFDPTWFASQIFWLVLIFAGFYWIMSRKVLPRVGAVIDAREQRIAGDLEQAERLRAEAQAALAAYESAIEGARTEARRVVIDAQERIKRHAEQVEADIARELDAKAREAEGRIAAAKREALGNVREIAVAAAGAAVERLVGGEVDPARIEAAVDAGIEGAS